MKNQNIKLIFLFLLALLISCGDTTDSSAVTLEVNTPLSTLPFSIVEKDGNPILLTISNHSSSNALEGTTNWSSSDTRVATVSGGVLRFATTTSPTNVSITATIGGYSTNKEVSIDSVDDSGNVIVVKGNQTNLIISESMTTISNNAYRKKGLTSIIIPNLVTNIGNGAFSQNQLTSVIIPDSVMVIGAGSFEGNQLTSLIISDLVVTIDDGAFANNKLTSVTIPDSVVTIGDSAFDHNQLTSVIIGKSVKTIGDATFAQNQLTSVIIPDSVTDIGTGGFFGNPSLTNVTLSVTLYNTLGTRRAGRFGGQVQNWYKLDGTSQ